jgi:hypothetical protein
MLEHDPGKIMPFNKSGDESPVVIFYLTYMNLRSIRRYQTAKLPGKRRARVIAARFSTALPANRTQKCLHGG